MDWTDGERTLRAEQRDDDEQLPLGEKLNRNMGWVWKQAATQLKRIVSEAVTANLLTAGLRHGQRLAPNFRCGRCPRLLPVRPCAQC